MDNTPDESIDPHFITETDLWRRFKLEEALFEFARLFNEEANDRAMVIVGVAFLDTQLEHVLANALIDDEKEVTGLLQPDRPLGSYGTRVRVAYCLGLISRTVRDDLLLIGKIRNKFAHDLYASFGDDPIRSWASSLQWHRKTYLQPPPDASARDLFHVGVNRLVAYLGVAETVARVNRRSSPREPE